MAKRKRSTRRAAPRRRSTRRRSLGGLGEPRDMQELERYYRQVLGSVKRQSDDVVRAAEQGHCKTAQESLRLVAESYGMAAAIGGNQLLDDKQAHGEVYHASYLPAVHAFRAACSVVKKLRR